MPTAKGNRRGLEEKDRRGKLPEKASSFHGRSPGATGEKLARPRTLPNLLVDKSVAGYPTEARPKLTKLLLNVTIQRSLGPVQVVMSQESTVDDLITAVLRQFAKEGRRQILPSTDPRAFDLHYSQFSLESLDREEKLMSLGSRNFFLCPKKSGTGTASCSEEAEKATKTGRPWLKFMEFLL